MNRKRVYRLYKEEGLEIGTKSKKKRVAQGRVPLAAASGRNQRWSIDFVTDRLEDGRYFQILTVLDQYSRECLALHAAIGMTGERWRAALQDVLRERGRPQAITVDR